MRGVVGMLVFTGICLLGTGCQITPFSNVPVAIERNNLPELTVPVARRIPRVDASADDPAWQEAAVISTLSLSRGGDNIGMTASSTRVLLLWQESFLYVRFISIGREYYSPIHGRDAQLYQADVVEVFLDPVGDGRQIVELAVSPANDVFDQVLLLTCDAKCNEHGRLLQDILARDFWSDRSWDINGLKTASRIEGSSWIVDIAIPAADLLRRRGVETFRTMDLRANFLRYEYRAQSIGQPRRHIAMNWSVIDHGCPHISPGAFGILRLR